MKGSIRHDQSSYVNKGERTPFETLLKYSNQKQKSAEKLAVILAPHIKKKHIDFLDIGSGTGEYLKKALDLINLQGSIDFVLLEPSLDLVKGLKKTILTFPPKTSTVVINQTWENFITSKKFSVILASHLYFITKDKYYDDFLKMINLLKEDGVLIYVLRQKDDVYDFKMTFEPRLFQEEFQAATLDEAVEVFKKLSMKNKLLNIHVFSAEAELKIPLRKNFNDTITIIEFYLNKQWNDIPDHLQEEIITYIRHKKGIFHQKDGLALVHLIRRSTMT